MKFFEVHLDLMANLLQTLNFLRTRMMEDEQVSLFSSSLQETFVAHSALLKAWKKCLYQ